MTPDSIVITIVYTVLLFWGAWVGVRQVYQGFRRPQELLNPLFGNRAAIVIFTFHLFIVSLDLFVCGPLALHYKSQLWYWGGRIALLSSSFPLAFFSTAIRSRSANSSECGCAFATPSRFRCTWLLQLSH